MNKQTLATALWHLARYGNADAASLRPAVRDLMFRQMMSTPKAVLVERLDARRARYGSAEIDALLEAAAKTFATR